jgi:ribosomal subunit interface protein
MMQINVSGKHIDIGQSLQQHVEEKLTTMIPKYMDRVVEVDVVFTDEAHLFRCDIVLNTGTKSHLIIKGNDLGGDAYACFDAAAVKLKNNCAVISAV